MRLWCFWNFFLTPIGKTGSKPQRASFPTAKKEATMPLVEIENLTKVYRKGTQEVTVLQDLDLSVDAGDFVALMGPSGSGKTTLLNLIAGIDRPTSGRLVVAGQELATLSRSQLAAWRAE